MRSVYNSLAKDYDSRQDSPATIILRQKEVGLIKRFAFGKILDLGCGTGYHLSLFWEKGLSQNRRLSHYVRLRLPKNNATTDVFGLDVSEKMLKIAKAKRKHLIQASIENLPIKTGCIDTTCCFFGTLNFVGLNCAGEFSRVIRTGGKILLSVTSVMDIDKYRSSPEAKVKKFRVGGQQVKMRLFEKEEVVEAFEKYGFRLKYFDSIFRKQKPRWGNFQKFSFWEKLKLKAERLFPKELGKVYFFVFEKG